MNNSLEGSLLQASGLDEKQVVEYMGKLDVFERNYYSKIKRKGTNLLKARWLVDYIWGMNEDVLHDSSLLPDTIDSVLEGKVGGDCVSLSALYSVMGLRIGIEEMGVCYFPGHIFNFVICDGEEVLVDMTNPQMFKFKPYCDFKKGGLDFLVSRTWNNRANDILDDDFNLAIEFFENSLSIDPDCVESLSVSSALYAKRGDFMTAFGNIHRAIELYPELAKNYNLRAYVKEAAGDIDGALEDVRIAMKLDPTDPDFEINLKELLGIKKDGPNGI